MNGPQHVAAMLETLERHQREHNLADRQLWSAVMAAVFGTLEANGADPALLKQAADAFITAFVSCDREPRPPRSIG